MNHKFQGFSSANSSSVNIKLSKTQLPKMVLLGGCIPLLPFISPKDLILKSMGEPSVKVLVNKGLFHPKKIFYKYFLNAGLNTVRQEIMSSRITLTNNEAKDIIKIITFLENRGILWKGTTGKIISQEEESVYH